MRPKQNNALFPFACFPAIGFLGNPPALLPSPYFVVQVCASIWPIGWIGWKDVRLTAEWRGKTEQGNKDCAVLPPLLYRRAGRPAKLGKSGFPLCLFPPPGAASPAARLWQRPSAEFGISQKAHPCGLRLNCHIPLLEAGAKKQKFIFFILKFPKNNKKKEGDRKNTSRGKWLGMMAKKQMN